MKKDLRKIAIIGHMDSGLSAAISDKLNAMGIGAEMMTLDEINSLSELARQEPITMKLEPPTIFTYPFPPPLTRAERRKQQRNK